MSRHPDPGPADTVGWPRGDDKEQRGMGTVGHGSPRLLFTESPTGIPGEGAEVLNCQQVPRQPL